MTPSLERLAELVRQAEAKTRARKIESETQQAAEQFRAVEETTRHAVERLRVVRPASLRAIEQADTDEHLLKDLVRKLAQFKSSLESQTDAEQLITTSQAEIERTRKQARVDLEEITKVVEEARRELRPALDHYRQLRRELDRLQPELAEQFADTDRLLWDAESHFPGGQLQLLGHEIEAGFNAYANLPKAEQYARLKVWIGRFRCYQASHDRDNEMTEELQTLGHRVFHQLKWLSRHYEPGYIEAFRQDYSTDWNAYVAEAQEQLAQAIETSRRNRDADPSRGHDLLRNGDHSHSRTPSRMFQGRSSGYSTAPRAASTALDQLQELLDSTHLPPEGLSHFQELVKRALDDVGADDPDLLDLVYPFSQYLADDEQFAELRGHLDEIAAEEGASEDSPYDSLDDDEDEDED
jgi:hypothetical protein